MKLLVQFIGMSPWFPYVPKTAALNKGTCNAIIEINSFYGAVSTPLIACYCVERSSIECTGCIWQAGPIGRIDLIILQDIQDPLVRLCQVVWSSWPSSRGDHQDHITWPHPSADLGRSAGLLDQSEIKQTGLPNALIYNDILVKQVSWLISSHRNTKHLIPFTTLNIEDDVGTWFASNQGICQWVLEYQIHVKHESIHYNWNLEPHVYNLANGESLLRDVHLITSGTCLICNNTTGANNIPKSNISKA